jgi:hypothetical protein
MEYYVYGHYTLDGRLFYVGKGVGDRAWVKRSRNPHWKNVANKCGLEVKILVDSLTEEEALQKEKELIEEIGIENLTNMRPGGRPGPIQKGKRLTAEHKKNLSKAKQLYWEDKRKPRRMSPEQVAESRKRAASKLSEKWKDTSYRTSLRAKLSDAAKKASKVTCSYCGKIMFLRHFVRWHEGGKCGT